MGCRKSVIAALLLSIGILATTALAQQNGSSTAQPVSTAGGVFGSGGPRALQIGVRVTF